jgi:hypothetical protein
VVSELFLAHLAKSPPRFHVTKWQKYKHRALLCLLDPSFLPEQSWHTSFSIGKGKSQREAHLDDIFCGVIKMPWHPEPAVVIEEDGPEAPDSQEDPELHELWDMTLANMGLIPCPSYDVILEQLHMHYNKHSGKDPVFSICYARTSSEGKAADKTSSYRRQMLSFTSNLNSPSLDGVPAIPLCIVHNPKGEPSFFPWTIPIGHQAVSFGSCYITLPLC